MIVGRTKVIFSIGFTFGAILVAVLNYLTFIYPRWYRDADGSLSMHGPKFSGFPFDMYMDGYTFDMLLPAGSIGNVFVAVLICTVFGWLATKFPGRIPPLK